MNVAGCFIPSYHENLRRIAPSAHHRLEADGAHAHPEGPTRHETADVRLAAAEHPRIHPARFDVRVGGVDLHLVDAARTAWMIPHGGRERVRKYVGAVVSTARRERRLTHSTSSGQAPPPPQRFAVAKTELLVSGLLLEP